MQGAQCSWGGQPATAQSGNYRCSAAGWHAGRMEHATAKTRVLRGGARCIQDSPLSPPPSHCSPSPCTRPNSCCPCLFFLLFPPLFLTLAVSLFYFHHPPSSPPPSSSPFFYPSRAYCPLPHFLSPTPPPLRSSSSYPPSTSVPFGSDVARLTFQGCACLPPALPPPLSPRSSMNSPFWTPGSSRLCPSSPSTAR